MVPKIPKEVDSLKDDQGKGESTEAAKTNEEGPVHPYANIPEARYAPPATKNFGVPMDKTLKRKRYTCI